MISASAKFKEAVRQGANVVNYADMTLRDGTTLTLEPANFMINGCVLEDSTTSGVFSVGSAIGKTVDITLANHQGQFDDYDFYRATFVLYCGILIDNAVEKVRKGTYYVVEPETPGDIIRISAVDAMHFFDRDYDTNLQYPATLHSILSDACTKCGVEPAFTHFDNDSFQVMVKPTECTYRDVVSWVAQIAGYNARINNFGALDLVWWKENRHIDADIDGGDFEDYDPRDYIIDGGDFDDYSQTTIYDGGDFNDSGDTPPIHSIRNLNVGTDIISITGIKVITDEAEVLEGTDDYCIEVRDNDLALGKESEIAEYLYNKLSPFQFRIMSVQILCNPLFEPFDRCTVVDRKGIYYNTLVNHVSYNNGSYTLLECQADPPIRNESYYSSATARAVVKGRRQTAEQISEYDVAVQNMNRIAANALGYFTTNEDQPDGSRITYLHDKSDLENSEVIYKISADGFFVSTDGGETYTAGFDAQGNAVVNILSAIGIRFDWARGGTLILGGDNNTNGEIQIMNADGVACGKINNNGISIYSPTSQVQVIITPEIGLVIRDADGNEFYGLTTRQNFTADFSPSYRILRTYNMYQNSLALHAVVVAKQNVSSAYFTTYKYRMRWYWTCTPAWLYTDSVPSPAGSSVRSLPSSFRNKNISVQFTNNGMTQDVISASTKNKVMNHYNSNVVKTKADGTSWTDTNFSSDSTYMNWNVGDDIDVTVLSSLESFWSTCQYYTTAKYYAGTNHALGTMPAQNDYLTDLSPAISPTSEFTYDYSYVTDNTVPKVTLSNEATMAYTGYKVKSSVVSGTNKTIYSQEAMELALPIPDLFSLTMVATC